MTPFSLIVCLDKDRGIGKAGTLPWHVKADMAWFKSRTLETSGALPNAVIMGRKTWDSIPAKYCPLSGRVNIIITRHPQTVNAPFTAGSLEEALSLADEKSGHSYIIGGAEIYAQALSHPQLSTAYITTLDRSFNCDTFLPQLPGTWNSRLLQKGEEKGLRFQVESYVRNNQG